MKNLFFLAVVVVLVGISGATPAHASDDGLVCRAPVLACPAIDLFSFEDSIADQIEARAAALALLEKNLGDGGGSGGAPSKGGPFRYSINDSVSAAMSYHHTFLFDTATNKELRRHRFGAFSTDRERDVLGLGMDWSVGESVVGLGYQLESSRPAPSRSAPTSIVPRSEEVEHAFTFGVTRSWGGSD